MLVVVHVMQGTVLKYASKANRRGIGRSRRNPLQTSARPAHAVRQTLYWKLVGREKLIAILRTLARHERFVSSASGEQGADDWHPDRKAQEM